MARELLRVFCEGRRSEPHERTRMVADHALLMGHCPCRGCGHSISHERVHRSVPAEYRQLMKSWLGDVLADWADIGAIDVIFVGLFDPQIEYPRRDQVA